MHGSAPLLAHGLIDGVRDIDIVARGAAWRRACDLGEVRYGRVDRMVTLPGDIEIFDGWLGESADALVARATRLHGLPVVRLDDVLRSKLALARPKDAPHVALLRRALAEERD